MVRLAILVVGGLVVLQSSAGLEPPKVVYFALAGAAFFGSCWAVWGMRHRPMFEVARPWLIMSAVFFALIGLSLPVALAHGTSLSNWVRDAATYGLFAAAPVFALDAAASRRRDLLLGLAVVITATGALSFLVNWITIRNLAVLPISQFVLPTSSLPTTLFLIALAAAIVDRGQRAWWIVLAGLGLGVFFVTGSRSAVLFFAAIPVMAFLAGRQRIAGSTLTAIGAVAVAIAFVVTLQAGFRLASRQEPTPPAAQPPPEPIATPAATAITTSPPTPEGSAAQTPQGTAAATATATAAPTPAPTASASPAEPAPTYRPPPNPEVTLFDRIRSFLAAPLSDASFQERAAQYRAAWDLFVSSPIVGTGLGHPIVWTRWDGSLYSDFTADTPLLLPAKLGLLGVAGVVLLATVWYRFVRRLHRLAGATIAGLALAGWAAILIVLAWTGFTIEDKGFSFAMMFLLALGFAETERPSTRADAIEGAVRTENQQSPTRGKQRRGKRDRAGSCHDACGPPRFAGRAVRAGARRRRDRANPARRPLPFGSMSEVALVWIPSGLLAWVYVGYPLVASLIARVAPKRLAPTGRRPTLTVAIAVHDSADQIEDRLRDVFAQDGNGVQIVEVLVGNDGSSDETAAIVRSLQAAEPRLRLVDLPRAGQTPTQHALFEAATGDVVVLTDAETRFAPGSLGALADAFRDPRVGCATGRLEWRNEDATATSANEGLYWRYERWVRDLETRAGLLTAVTGAVLAVRRSSYRAVPASASMDHLLPLYVREAGGLVVYVPSAVATDRPISGLREQYRNRTRTATRGIWANLSMAGRLAPWRHPKAALAIWSHKLFRWGTPWLVLWAGSGGTVLAITGQQGYAVVPTIITGGLAAAAAGHVIAGTGHRPPRILAFARAIAIINVAFARAWLDVAMGRRITAWHGTAYDPKEVDRAS